MPGKESTEWISRRNIPFWVGVGIACASLIATRWLPRDAEPGPHHVIVPETPPQEEVPAIVEV